MAWNGSDGAAKPQEVTGRSKPSAWRGLLAAIIIVGGAAGAYLMFLGPASGGSARVRGKDKVAKIAEVTPELSSQTVEEAPAAEEPQKPKELPPFVKRPGALQLPDGKVITFNPPAEGEEKSVYVHGRKYIVDAFGNFNDVTPKPTFDNRFENTLEGMSAVGGGVMPAVALSIPNEDITKYLVSPIELFDDDPEDVVEKKIATAEMKELLKEYLMEGGTWEDFVMEISNIKRNEQMLHAQAIAEIARMLRDGDEDGAQMYREKVDELLNSKGYKSLKLPTSWGVEDVAQ